MSTKIAMVRELRKRGVTKSESTLRKMSVEDLRDWLVAVSQDAVAVETQEVAPIPEAIPFAQIAPPVPSDAELYRLAIVRQEPVKATPTWHKWVALALAPFVLLRSIIG